MSTTATCCAWMQTTCFGPASVANLGAKTACMRAASIAPTAPQHRLPACAGPQLIQPGNHGVGRLHCAGQVHREGEGGGAQGRAVERIAPKLTDAWARRLLTPALCTLLQNSRRGDFARPKVRGKRALELGAGMGLAGMALAFLGAGERRCPCIDGRGALLPGTLPVNRRIRICLMYVVATMAPCLSSLPIRAPAITLPTILFHPPAATPADVTFTDIGDVLPLLQRNVEQNISPAALKGARCLQSLRTRAGCAVRQPGWTGSGALCSRFASLWLRLPLLIRRFPHGRPPLCAVKDAAWAAAEVGKVRVASLDWADPACYAAFAPPYDFLLAADCVYSELAGERLCWPAGWKSLA